MAALLILATAIFALLQAQTQNITRTVRMSEQARAVSLAETALDQFLASPEFELAGDAFAGEATVTLRDFDTEGFRITRIISERVPLEDQDSIYVTPDEEPYYPLTEDEAKEQDENPFDPGKFVSVRVEVWRSKGEPRLLATLETWLSKPLTEEEAAEAGTSTTAPSSSGTGSTGTTGSGGGTGTGGGRTGTGGTTRPTTGGGTTRPTTGGGTSGTSRPTGSGTSGTQGRSGR